MANKSCLIFLCHIENFTTKINLCKIKDEIKDCGIDVYDYNPDWSVICEEYSEYLFKCDDNVSYRGNTIYSIFKFFTEHQEYDNYYVMEYDCFYTGNYGEMFRKLENKISEKHYDALLQHREISKDGIAWHWLNNDAFRFDESLNVKHYYQQLYQFYCLSAKCLKYLMKECMSKKYYGHHELILPTMMLRSGLNVGYMTDFVNMCMGVMAWELPNEKNINTMYHPIKEISQLKFKNNNQYT